MAYDYEDGDFKVTLQDSGVPTAGRFVAKIEYLKGPYSIFTYYQYGATKDEALEESKAWITEYKAA